MHIPQHILVDAYRGVTSTRPKAEELVLLLGGSSGVWEWAEWVALAIRSLISMVVKLVGECCRWVVEVLQDAFRDPAAWLLHILALVYAVLRNHPHLVCITSLCLFAGPVVVLLPFLILHEIAILLLFNLNFVGHGLLPGRIEDQYEDLKERFVESRERAFASVESATSTFNQWTADHFALRVLRILAGVLGLYAAWGLWEGRWPSPPKV